MTIDLRSIIRARLAELGMTQADLAEAIGWPRARNGDISRYLSGARECRSDMIELILVALRMHITPE